MRIFSSILKMRNELYFKGNIVQTARWQGKEAPPAMIEILQVAEKMQMCNSIEQLQIECNPWLPWADEHFEERVSGLPLNPPPSHTKWLTKTSEYFSGDVKFSHSYPERFWSKGLHQGIRFEIADLNTLIEVLRTQPDTRQAYLPMFFPEDLSASLLGERIPCSLGWNFIVRNNKLHCTYAMRSCDAVRHFHNDIYFANRLALYVAEQAQLDVEMGTLLFISTSLHCFENDRYALKKLIGAN